jgi:DNA-binding MarR family transcriptional regulator
VTDPRSRIAPLVDGVRVLVGWRTAHRLTCHQAEILVLLYDAGAATSAELSRGIGITTASMARIVPKLEGGGWIERTADERDARRTLLLPTKQLSRAIEELDERRAAAGIRPTAPS